MESRCVLQPSSCASKTSSSSSAGYKKEREDPIVVTYNNPPKRKQKLPKLKNQSISSAFHTSNDNTAPKPSFDFKRARWEVRKYGIQSLTGSSKEEAMTSLLIRLGAKPPKKECINYKLLQEQIKVKKAKQHSENGLENVDEKKMKGRKAKNTKDRNDIGSIDGQIGRFRNGVQIINQKEMRQFKKHSQKTKRKTK